MRPLIRLAPLLTRATARGGDLILSGLLTKQEPLVRLAYESRGMILTQRIRRDAWTALALRKPRAG
jgi:ribosomal protein L11 methyltransferase